MMISVRTLICLSGITAAAFLPSSVLAQDNSLLSQSNHGGVGLIQIPTARMEDSGHFSFNYNDNEDYRFWSVSIQLFPWLETTARYTDVRRLLYSPFPGFSGDQSLKDKGLDVKIRLLEESYYVPQVSVGWRDFGGTGFFESEYIAASKRLGDFDFHLGMGWGYLGRAGNISNPFCQLSDGFCQRPGGFSGNGGKVDYDQFYKGPASLIAGVEYHTPWLPLTLKLEYEGNNYATDRAPDLVQDSRFNYGLVYRYKNIDLQASYQRGNTFAFGISLDTNFNTIKQPKFDTPAPEVNAQGANPAKFSRAPLRKALYQDAGFVATSIFRNNDELIVKGKQIAFRDEAVAMERVGRVLANFGPDNVARYRIVVEEINLPMVETVFDVAEFRAVSRYERLDTPVRSTYVRKEPDVDDVIWQFNTPVRGLGFSLDSFWTQMLGNPEAFFMYQGGVLPTIEYHFDNNWSVMSVAKVSLLDNYDKFNFKVDAQDSTLPRVRTYAREYATRSNITLDRLFLSYRDNIVQDWYAQAYAGYLETMFAGVGGEVLYRPLDSNLAFGVDLNYVRQRDYDSETALFDYSVLTGFVSAYWQPTFVEDAMLAVSVGRFLAKDVGVNIDFSRRFDSGVVVGAYAAFTDASAEEYGEGSFTKGFYVSIPFDLLSFKSTKGAGSIPWVPIGRDGGQMLQRPMTLLSVTNDRAVPKRFVK